MAFTYRVERDGETFYVPPGDLASYSGDGYSVYRSGTGHAQPGGLTPQGDDDGEEFEIPAEDMEAYSELGVEETTASWEPT